MLQVAELEQAMGSARQVLAADGFRLAIENLTGDTVTLSVEPEDGVEGCASCLLPKESIEMLVLQELRSQGLSVAAVRVNLRVAPA